MNNAPRSATARTDHDGLRVEHLEVTIGRGRKALKLVEDLSFDVPPGRMLGLVGESGSGKSMTASALLGLLPWGARISRGSVALGGHALANLPERRMRPLRGREMGMIFQNPLSSLNPTLSIARQIGEPYRIYTGATEAQARERGLELLREVGVPDAEHRLDDYPHQFSGGMRQRVMIAMALACRPRLLIADEPTTSLDVTIQAQILRLLKRLQEEMSLSVILITHDLSLVAEYADEIAVMYAGRCVEQAPARDFFRSPRHPYSHALLNSIPRLDGLDQRLTDIEGIPPTPQDFPPGCRFAPRCALATAECREAYPPAASDTRRYHCFHPQTENR